MAEETTDFRNKEIIFACEEDRRVFQRRTGRSDNPSERYWINENDEVMVLTSDDQPIGQCVCTPSTSPEVGHA